MNETETPSKPHDKLIRAIMGVSVFVIGLYSCIAVGLVNIFSEDLQIMGVSMVLVIVGMIFCHAGAALVQHFCSDKRVLGQGLFCICFAASVAMIIIGLSNVFSHSASGVYLILVGFLSSIIASLAMK